MPAGCVGFKSRQRTELLGLLQQGFVPQGSWPQEAVYRWDFFLKNQNLFDGEVVLEYYHVCTPTLMVLSPDLVFFFPAEKGRAESGCLEKEPLRQLGDTTIYKAAPHNNRTQAVWTLLTSVR